MTTLRWRAALLLGGVLAAVLAVRSLDVSVPELLARLEDLGPSAGLAFMAIYVIATIAWVPGSLLTLGAGAAFGLVWGTLYTLTGATLGAAAAFLISRYIARAAIERKLGAHRRLRAVDEAIARQGPKVVLLVRLSPAFPFNALNYALGLTRVRFRDYVPTSFIGMVPGTFLYVYAGHTAGRIAGGVTGGLARGPWYYALLVVGLVATVAVTAVITRAARQALETEVSPGS